MEQMVSDSEKYYTRNDNVKSPGFSKCIQWFSDIWENFSGDLIRKSFEKCGIMHQY